LGSLVESNSRIVEGKEGLGKMVKMCADT
jgi:hypothetical protein